MAGISICMHLTEAAGFVVFTCRPGILNKTSLLQNPQIALNVQECIFD